MPTIPTRQSGVRRTLLRGKQQLEARFGTAPPLTLRAGEVFAAAGGLRDAIYRLRTGWACQYRELPNCRRAIIDVYLPGDLIGLDGLFTTRPLNVLALTLVEVATIDGDKFLTELLACQSNALYVAWLLVRRQQRTDHLLTAISSLDARGRLAAMLLDFYKRLDARKLIAASNYTMPLTQQHTWVGFGHRIEIKSHFRRAISPWIDRRQKLDIIRDEESLFCGNRNSLNQRQSRLRRNYLLSRPAPRSVKRISQR
jgi:CRP-like cAMP-binding protein